MERLLLLVLCLAGCGLLWLLLEAATQIDDEREDRERLSDEWLGEHSGEPRR